MTRLPSLPVVAIAATLAVPTYAQSALQPRPVPGPVRDAGVYHVATGTWTRGRATANISPDAIYRNDAPSAYFGTGWEGCWSIDEVMLPGPNNPLKGWSDAYLIDGFEFTYCKDGAGTIDWTFGYFRSYMPCDDPTTAGCIDESPRSILLTGLPGGSACWVVTLDLSGGYEICISADAEGCFPGYQGGKLGLDHAGLGLGWTTSDGGFAGPILSGDPTWHPRGDGTCYQPTYSNACGSALATGLGAMDLFSITNYDFGGTGTFSSCALPNGCYFFGGYMNNNGCGTSPGVPFCQFEFVHYADCTIVCDFPRGPGTVYCDESQNPNNSADISISGEALGVPITVDLAKGPSGQFGYLLIGSSDGTVSQPPGAKGDLCLIGGFIGRYDEDVFAIDASGGGSTDLESSASGGPNYGIPNGGGNIQPGDTWYFQYWHRQLMGQPATFSSAIEVTFQ